MVRSKLVYVCLVALIAGCVAGSGTQDTTTTTSVIPSSNADVGILTGTVTDEALAPLAGAEVALIGLNRSTATDASGRFQLDGLEPGSYKVAAQKIGYQSAAQSSQVEAGEVTDITFVLVALPTEEPYHVTQTKAAYIGCSVDVRQTSSNASLFTFAICGVVYYVAGETVDQFRLDWDIEPVEGIAGLAVESTWRSTQAAGNGLYIWWVGYRDGTLNSMLGLKGNSPQRGVIEGTVFKATHGKGPCPQLTESTPPCELTSFHYTHASTVGNSYPVDAGVTLQQRIDDYVTTFYVEPPPPGFTALPPA